MPPEFKLAAEELLNELESSRLEVILIPQRHRTNEGGMCRVAVSKNAGWYRRFCAKFISGRRRRNAALDTSIKRALVIRTLSDVAGGTHPSSIYFTRLRPFIEARASLLLGS